MRFFKPRLSNRPAATLNPKRRLSIDLETFSEVNIQTAGLYRYVRDPSFQILLFAYAFDDEPVRCIDLANFEDIPEEVEQALLDPEVLKTAWNAQFEFEALSTIYPLQQEQWRCTMVQAGSMSLPLKLGEAAKAMGLPIQKDFSGLGLIKYFCVPVEPTKTNGGRKRNYPEHAPDKWERFKAYCIKDVEVERMLAYRMNRVDHMTTFERGLYFLDQYINKDGVKVHRKLIENAIKIDDTLRAELLDEAKELTGLQNPNSVAKIKTWLSSEIEEELETLNKEKVLSLLKKVPEGKVKRVLEIRQLLSKSSVRKYMAMTHSMGDDDRIRGLLQIYGAARTARWAGRLVQVQNLPRISMKDAELKFARQLVIDGDIDSLQMLYNNVPLVLSELIRTAFIAEEGHELMVADLSAIEACVLAWLANEQWRLNVFNSHGKIYEASASMLFGIPIDQITEDSEERQHGKVAELALGYGGGVGALTTMDIKKKLKDSEKQPLVNRWRETNPNIVNYWHTIESAVIRVLQHGQPIILNRNMSVFTQKGVLFIQLPSGRRLSYLQPKLEVNKFGNGYALTYMGQNQYTKKWERLDTYGGKLVENITQAVARDVLAEALVRLDLAGYKTVMHIHDEIVAEQPIGQGSIEEMCRLMCVKPAWGKTLPLKAKGFVSPYYKK